MNRVGRKRQVEERKVRKRRKKSAKEQLRDQNDDMWAEIIHRRDAKQGCLVCGPSDKAMNAHHLIGRGNYATRHDPENGVLLCVHHHCWNKECSPHSADGGPGWNRLLDEKYPEKREYIERRRREAGSYTLAAMTAANEMLKLELAKVAGL